MGDFLVYWKGSNSKYIQVIGGKAAYHGSSKFESLGVSKGDRLWVTTLKSDELYLVSKIFVEQIVKDRKRVESILGTHDLIDMPEYALAAQPHSPIRQIRISDLARELSLKFNCKGRIEPQQFRSPRQLTSENAQRLQNRWQSGIQTG
jgi:hypothetical protein